MPHLWCSTLWYFFLLLHIWTILAASTPKHNTQFDFFLWCIGKIGKSGGYIDGMAPASGVISTWECKANASIRYLFQSPPDMEKIAKRSDTAFFLFSKTRILRLYWFIFRECGVCMCGLARRTPRPANGCLLLYFFEAHPNVKRINKKTVSGCLSFCRWRDNNAEEEKRCSVLWRGNFSPIRIICNCSALLEWGKEFHFNYLLLYFYGFLRGLPFRSSL